MEDLKNLNSENIANRKRKNQYLFSVDDEEKEIIENKFLESGLPTKRVFFLKSILESMIIKLDISDIKAHTKEISKIGNNINQIAHKANFSNLKKEDIEYIKNQMALVLEEEKEIVGMLNLLKK